MVEVRSDHGRAILRVMRHDRAALGQVFVPMHWTRQHSRNGTVNSLTGPAVDPISGQPALKSGAVTVKRFDGAWYGFAAGHGQMAPEAEYAAVMRSATGWRGEFGGRVRPENWEEYARNLLACPQDHASVVQDTHSGLVRIAFHKGAVLTGLFFASPSPVRLGRDHVVALIGPESAALQALAGWGGADQVDPGQTICACMNVGINTVRDAISAGAATVDAIGRATCAGTNCGSCKPELSALLAENPLSLAAE
jgi:assimilatory nitrate reductase catalytic subunit